MAPQRFELLLDVATALQAEEITIEHLRNAYKNAAAITAQPLLERGFKGIELGEQLRRERLAAIQCEWN